MNAPELSDREVAARNWPFASMGTLLGVPGFRPAPMPANEAQRVEALTRTQILDSLPERAYDDLVALASQICGTPIALISMIDKQRQWFKAKVGLPSSETPRDLAFCSHAILVPDEVFAVNDAHCDDRFAVNPLVAGEPHIRFYAGAPIVTDDGHTLGTVCVIDHKARSLDASQKRCLQILARQASSLLKARRDTIDAKKRVEHQKVLTDEARLRHEHGEELLNLVLDGSELGMWNLHVPSGHWTVNVREWSMLGFSEGEATSERLNWKAMIHPDDRALVRSALERHASGAAPHFECIHRMRHHDGHWVSVLSRAVIVEKDAKGRPVRIVGTHRDVSE